MVFDNVFQTGVAGEVQRGTTLNIKKHPGIGSILMFLMVSICIHYAFALIIML